MAAAPAAGGRGAAPVPQAQGPQGEPARGAEGAWPWDRDCDAVSDPLGGEALPLVVEVYGWLSWASSGTTRGMINQPFDAVLLQRDGGNQEVPPRGMGGPRGPREGPPCGDLGSVAQQGADAAGFPGGRGGAPHHGCGCQQLAPLGLAQRPHRLALPPAEPATAAAPGDGCAPPAEAMSARWWGGDSAAGRPPQQGRAPDPERDTHPPPPYDAAEGRAPPPVGERTGQRAREEAHCPAAR